MRVPGAVPDVGPLRDAVAARLDAVAFTENAGALRPTPGQDAALWDIGRDPALQALPDAFAAVIAQVLGPGWAQAAGEAGGVTMPTRPLPGPWSACAAAWHVDEAIPAGAPPGRVALAFVYLDEVPPGGSGTVLVAGSARRLAAFADVDVTTDVALARLGAEPWFAALRAADAGVDHPSVRAGCTSGGVDLRVVELTGAPGDVIVWDPRGLHTIAANVSDRPRLIQRLTALRA